MSETLPGREPTDNDIAWAKVHADAKFRQSIAVFAGRAGVVLCASAPLTLVWFAIKSLAGQTTSVQIGVSISVVLAVTGIPAVWIMTQQRQKVVEQGKELERLRGRIQGLEQENDLLRKG